MNEINEIQHVIEDVLQKIVAEYSPQKIILFGSHAYGQPDENSDIDLLIIEEVLEKGKVLYIFNSGKGD